jgi:hypothetical protein
MFVPAPYSTDGHLFLPWTKPILVLDVVDPGRID